MKTQLTKVEKTTSYGHYKIGIQFRDGKYYETITTDSMTYDDYNSDEFTVADQKKVRRAEKSLIRKVKKAHDLK
jgi:hypothetical protein